MTLQFHLSSTVTDLDGHPHCFVVYVYTLQSFVASTISLQSIELHVNIRWPVKRGSTVPSVNETDGVLY